MCSNMSFNAIGHGRTVQRELDLQVSTGRRDARIATRLEAIRD
jgi:hypothetical protein